MKRALLLGLTGWLTCAAVCTPDTKPVQPPPPTTLNADPPGYSTGCWSKETYEDCTHLPTCPHGQDDCCGEERFGCMARSCGPTGCQYTVAGGACQCEPGACQGNSICICTKNAAGAVVTASAIACPNQWPNEYPRCDSEKRRCVCEANAKHHCAGPSRYWQCVNGDWSKAECPANAPCEPATGNCVCSRVCAGKRCGDGDGCSGTCQPGSGCCTPACAGKRCGEGDGCGGTCQPGSGCCAPSCVGKRCGEGDGCGGTCQSGSGCCAPSCAGKQCGEGDGCGGTCQPGSGCCAPSCAGKQCGEGDGCGGTCVGSAGSCPSPQVCSNSGACSCPQGACGGVCPHCNGVGVCIDSACCYPSCPICTESEVDDGCGGVCGACPSSCCNHTSCCPAGTDCCGSACCGAGEKCCGGEYCCKSNEECYGGQACWVNGIKRKGSPPAKSPLPAHRP
jgi:hypothetical protein